MASLKVKFRPSTNPGHAGSIYYQIIHNRKARQIATDYRIYQSEWDKNRSRLMPASDGERQNYINAVHENIRTDINRLSRIVRRLEERAIDYSADDIIDEYTLHVNEYRLFRYMTRIIDKLKSAGRQRTAETYNAALNSFKKFLCETDTLICPHHTDDIMLDCLNSQIIEAYASWLHSRGLVPNTISFYARILRAVYNKAADAGIIEKHNPFRRVYTGIDKTIKRALPLAAIKRIKNLDLTAHPDLDYARDIFVMSFMLRGMSFIDMAFLKKKDLANGYIVYRRRKTGQTLSIKWTQDMQSILNKHPGDNNEYLLPIIKINARNPHHFYRNASYNIKRNLKKIAKLANIQEPLTLYVARHSWASAAKDKGVPVSVISEGMGHGSESTTRIYLASLDCSVVDQANHLILRSI